MDWTIIFPVLMGILGLIIGYFIGKSTQKSGDNSISAWKQKNAKLEADLEACKSKLYASGPSLASTSSSVSSSFASGGSVGGESMTSTADRKDDLDSSGGTFNADTAASVFGKKINRDDLKIVEGIGPKIEELFHNHDVKSWKDLSECSTEKCQNVLDSGGARYRMHDPKTWPQQAQMAFEGSWQDLLDWQDSLKGGK